MSLNRCEQQLFDYVQSKPDERQFWEHKVRVVSATCVDKYEASLRLDAALWEYLRERASVVPVLRAELGKAGAAGRVSMRNLAEYLLRLWGEPVTPKAARTGRK